MAGVKFEFSPESYIPVIGTVHREILELLANEEPTERRLLVDIDDNFRRVIQELEGDRFGFWAINLSLIHI